MQAEIRISGETRAIKDTLRSQGYRWESGSQSWVKAIDAATADVIRSGGEAAQEALRAIHGRKKGCVTHLCHAGTVGIEVYRSATAPTCADPVRGLDYADAAGNYVGGNKIAGSAPDDLI